jgi:hypothetical protein
MWDMNGQHFIPKPEFIFFHFSPNNGHHGFHYMFCLSFILYFIFHAYSCIIFLSILFIEACIDVYFEMCTSRVHIRELPSMLSFAYIDLDSYSDWCVRNTLGVIRPLVQLTKSLGQINLFGLMLVMIFFLTISLYHCHWLSASGR